MRTKKRAFLAIPLVLALFGLTAADCTARDAYVTDCLNNPNRPAPIIVPQPVPPSYWPMGEGMFIASHTPLDARGIRFANPTVSLKLNNGVDSRDDLCLTGGLVTTDLPVTTPWEIPDVDGVPTPPHWHAHYGIRAQSPNVKIVGTKFNNVGDGITFQGSATNWKMVGVNADDGGDATHTGGAFVHDDCVENDAMNAGQILDSKFDGCASFLSAIHKMSGNPADGHNNTVLVEGTMVRLMEMPGTFESPEAPPGKHGGFFKFAVPGILPGFDDGDPPKLVLRDSMFRADERGYYGGAGGAFLGVPAGTVCDNVVVIGWDAWQQRDRDSWIASCGQPNVGTPGDDDDIPNLRIGTIADWDTAEAAWDQAHPPLVR
jgi:hypothetical protein